MMQITLKRNPITNTTLLGVSIVSRTNSQEFDANWLRTIKEGLAGFECVLIDIASTDG